MQVLLVNGSSHPKGCTNAALEEIARSLAEEDIDSEIFFIGNKQILEAGSHEELMAKGGLYYHLYTTQMGKAGD